MFRQRPMIMRRRKQVVSGSRLQMTVWKRLYRSRGVGGRSAARVKAHAVADQAKRMGMYPSDTLQLMISAVAAADEGEQRDAWLRSVESGQVVNSANGLNLRWMLSQFTPEELGRVGDRAIELVGLSLEDWRSSSQ